MFKKLFISLVAVVLTIVPLLENKAEANSNVREQFTVSPGVTYKDIRTNASNNPQAIRVLETDLTNPFASIDVGYSQPINTLKTTTNFAKDLTRPNHRVVGAVNGSFFHFSNRYPAYLLMHENKILNLGVISTGLDEYMSVPTAFGMDQSGKGIIDEYKFQATFEHNGVSSAVHSVNKQRSANEIILFTPNWSYTSTRTNEFGMEIVVTGLPKSLDHQGILGETVTGTVSQVTAYGKGNSTIPSDGVVISIQGGALAAKYANVKAGDKISITLNVDDKWKNASFMLASGPMLVKDGKVNMTIDPNSSRARTRAPRTAVAIDKNRTKVFFVTVDGSQPGYSSGMTLTEFAQYLVSIGADRAINMDGGGSTTMVARNHGNTYATLMNTPSAGAERAVSTILSAISTAPNGKLASFSLKKSHTGSLLKGASLTVDPTKAMDEYYNPYTLTNSEITYSVEGNVGRMEGNRFIAEREGTGFIVGKVGNVTTKTEVSVIDKPTTVSIDPTSITLNTSSTHTFRIKAFDASGKELVVPANIVQWSATPALGTISNNGVLTTSAANSTGQVTATINGMKATANVTVTNLPISISSFESLTGWKASAARGTSNIELSKGNEPVFHGKTSMKLSYDFTVGEAGTKAAYVTAEPMIPITGKPNAIGVWVNGDGNKNWLRGNIRDASGKQHTINFTGEHELNWTGWRYVKAAIPANAVYPIQMERVYIAQSVAANQKKGAIYLDKLQAEYSTKYEEPLFRDVPSDHWAKNEIKYLVHRNIINGYADGSFKPEQNLTRVHAALLLAKEMNLPLTGHPDPGFTDVPKDHPYYNVISAVAHFGVLTGKENGTKFDPNGQLSRAQMAAILQRAYQLTGKSGADFKDVSNKHWAYNEINALKANNVTTGYQVDNTFRPENPVTRAQFSAFLYRTINR